MHGHRQSRSAVRPGEYERYDYPCNPFIRDELYSEGHFGNGSGATIAMARMNSFRQQMHEAAGCAAARLRAWSRRLKPHRATDDDLAVRGVRGDQGSTLIEFAVTLPVLLTLIFCFIEMCMLFYTYEMISEAARDGTRYAMVRGASCPNATHPTCEATVADVKAYVTGLGWPNIGGGTVTPSVVYDGGEAIDTHVTVTVTYTFQITMPFVPTRSISLSSTSKATILQ
jgi:Flp pilus assembly protein TadG